MDCPDANAVLRWNRVYLRQRIGVFFQVAMTDGDAGQVDLSGAKIDDVDTMDLLEIVDTFEEKVRIVRERKDPALERTRNTFQVIPNMLLNVFLKVLRLLTGTLNLDLRWAGIPNDPFGSIMVTNIGTLGLDVAFAPLVPYSGVPLLLAAGAVQDEPIVVDDELAVGKMMNLCDTFDHRFIDGVHAARLGRTIRRWIEDPYGYFGPVPQGDSEG